MNVGAKDEQSGAKVTQWRKLGAKTGTGWRVWSSAASARPRDPRVAAENSSACARQRKPSVTAALSSKSGKKGKERKGKEREGKGRERSTKPQYDGHSGISMQAKGDDRRRGGTDGVAWLRGTHTHTQREEDSR